MRQNNQWKSHHGGSPGTETGISSEVPVNSVNNSRQEVQPVGADFVCENHLSIFLLRPISPAAFDWINEHLPEDRQTFGDAVVIEPRYIWAILAGLQEDGLSVTR